MLGDDAEADDMTYERESDDEGEGEEDKENGAAAKLSVKEIALDEFAFDMDKVGLLSKLAVYFSQGLTSPETWSLETVPSVPSNVLLLCFTG